MSIAFLCCLALIDACFIGFRDAAGRNPLVDKRAYFRRALRRGATAGIVVLAGLGVLAGVCLTLTPARAALRADFGALAVHLLQVYGAYACAVLPALAIYAVPSLEARTLATVLVLGPCTMLRPWVIAGGALYGAALAHREETIFMALVSATSFAVLERILSRRWRATGGVSWE